MKSQPALSAEHKARSCFASSSLTVVLLPMEASLLVAPKPFFSIRGKSRRCLVAAAGHGKDLVDNNGQQVLVLSPASSKVAAIMSGGGACCLQALLPCKDASAAAMEAAPPAIMELYLVGDLLEPATAKTVAGVAGPALSALGFLFILRIVMSWYPRLPVTKFPYVLAYAPTEPFLAVTRKVIPPLGGVDVTPVVWFGLVSFLNEILVGPQGLLVLLSQQLQ